MIAPEAWTPVIINDNSISILKIEIKTYFLEKMQTWKDRCNSNISIDVHINTTLECSQINFKRLERRSI